MESIILSSKPTNQFPNNHGGDFRNAINHPLNVQYKPGQQFKVALAELFYVPGSWSNVRTGANYVDIELKGYPIDVHTLQTLHVDWWDTLDENVWVKLPLQYTVNVAWHLLPYTNKPPSGKLFLRLIRYLDKWT